MSSKGKFVILSGPSGSGKTTLHKALLASSRLKGRLVKSISATTRNKRVGEVDGRDYLFLKKEVFEQRLKRGYFLESEKVFDNYYGTPKIRALNLLKKGKHVLLCIDVKGAAHICQEFPNALKVFVTTPNMDVLRQRLKLRASETHESLSLRLKVAQEELTHAKEYDHIIVNDDLTKAIEELETIVCQGLGIGR